MCAGAIRFVLITLILATTTAVAATSGSDGAATARHMSAKQIANACSLLDDPKKRALMDSLELRLLVLCGRTSELGQVRSEREAVEARERAEHAAGADVLVNNPAGEAGPSQTQDETAIAINENTGTLCSGYNDSYSGVVQGQGYTGFSRSTDGGATFVDRGALGSSSFGDPSIVWRKSDGNFYFATLHSSGLGIWRSTDDCQSFQFLVVAHTNFNDDKELLAVDNNASSPNYGRIYLAYTNFSSSRIFATHSDDGSNWTASIALSAAGVDVQGAWPVVAPDGTVYIGWLRWNPYFTGPIDVEITRSTNGGQSFTLVTKPMAGKVNPYDQGPTNQCGRPALNGKVRYLPSPQLAVSPNGDLHVVYSYDPDGRNSGDVVNVYYRRSVDQGASWQPEVQLNDDQTTRDQFFPTLSVGPTGRVVTAWYDRRLDASNLLVDYFTRVSEDGGATWQPSTRISDVSSPIYLDPNLNTCYHGDYDQQLQIGATGVIQWGDDRAVRSGHNDPDTYVDRSTFASDFTIAADPTTQSVCAPAPGIYEVSVESIANFSDPVTLSASGNPAGTTVSFSVNPVIPTGDSTMTIGHTVGALAGTYAIDVTGTSGSLSHTAQVLLDLATSEPGLVSLSTPLDGATNVTISPTFTWEAEPDAVSYSIEIASDPAFANIVDAASVEETSYTTAVTLAPLTIYYWRVRAANICGEGEPSPAFSFTTVNLICRAPALEIPDQSPPGVTDTLTVAGSGTLSDLNVSLDVTHPFVGDLSFVLTHVDTGTTARIVDRPGVPALRFGCDGADIVATLDDAASSPVEDECADTTPTISGTFSPNEPLAAFNGEDLNGTWTLTAIDSAAPDPGTLNAWCLAPTTPFPDTDGDGVADDHDNCTLVANPTQHDTDGDGFGNQCDGDFNQDCQENFVDLGVMKANFFMQGDLETDMTENGVTNFGDLASLKSRFFSPPGPSGVPNSCD